MAGLPATFWLVYSVFFHGPHGYRRSKTTARRDVFKKKKEERFFSFVPVYSQRAVDVMRFVDQSVCSEVACAVYTRVAVF